VTARRIVHLGLGNFHRAHQAVYTADAAGSDDPWEILGVAPSSRAVVAALHRQAMAYHVVTLGPETTGVRRIESITDAFVAADDPSRLIEEIADPRTEIVSLTVTEKGYRLRPGSRELDLDAPDIRHDLSLTGSDGQPTSTIGRLSAGLLLRARTHGTPVTLLSCDNVAANGHTLAGLLRTYAASTPELLAYLDTAVTCPNTMVDRIVPATTDEHRALVAEHGGSPDAVPVPAEPFSMWVLEDGFAAGRPAWQRAGAVFSDQVHDYETVKVRLLNGCHSLLAYLGLLSGAPLIADAMADEAIARAAWRLGDEYLPTLRVPEDLDIAAYREQLTERFTNRRLGHRTAQVGSDGSLKLAQRIPAAALWHLDRGHTPVALALLTAAWLKCFARPQSLDTARTGAPADPRGDQLRELGAKLPKPRQLVEAALRDEAILGQALGQREEFTAAVADLLALLEDAGVHATLSTVLP
jgi:fructuronate reductase